MVDPPARGRVAGREVVEERVPVRRRPRRQDPYWPWLLLLLLLVLAGLGALWYFTREDSATVPEVVGLRESAAVERIEDADLDAVVRRLPNERPEGQVVSQRPRAGAELDAGDDVTVMVSTGPAQVAVPSVVGRKAADAEAALRGAGLDPRVRRIFSSEPPGEVVAQDPAAGERVASGASVRINVSKGTGRVAVPDLVGLTEDDAKAQLRRAGLAANVFEVPSADAAGTVVAQNPPAGDQAGKGDVVRINVSTGEGGGAGTGTGTDTTGTGTTATETTGGTETTGPSGSSTVTVPGVVGQQFRVAGRTLRDAGFRVLADYTTSRRPAGTVIAQRPGGGASAREGATVSLRVSSGPGARLRTVPDVVGLTREEAADELRRAGLTADVVLEPSPDPEEEGLVIRQAPAAGRRAPAGAAVTIYVATFEE